jgi:hypothetical protein
MTESPQGSFPKKSFIVGIFVVIALSIILVIALYRSRSATPAVPPKTNPSAQQQTDKVYTEEEIKNQLEALDKAAADANGGVKPMPPSDEQIKNQLEALDKAAADANGGVKPMPPSDEQIKKQLEALSAKK